MQRRIDNFETYLTNNTSLSLTTIRKNVNIVKLFFYDSLGQIEKPDGSLELDIEIINKWLSFKARTKSTVHYKYALRHLLISVGRKDLAEKLVTSKTAKRKKVFNFIAKNKAQDIVNALQTKHIPLALLQIKTGSRIGSVLTIRAENIDYEVHKHLIYIKIGVNKTLSKRSKEMTLKLSKKYEQLLKSWTVRPYGYLFLEPECEFFEDKELLSHLDTKIRRYNEDLAQAGRIYGIDAFSSHYLRHLYADYFIQAGGDPVYLQKALGHSKLDTTLRYVSITDKMVDSTIVKMEED